jgi:ribonuclease HI
VIVAADKTLPFQPLEIVSDSKYVIDGLTTNLNSWEDQGWAGTKHAHLFRRASYLLRKQSATTTFRWVKGHSGMQGNEESDKLGERRSKET